MDDAGHVLGLRARRIAQGPAAQVNQQIDDDAVFLYGVDKLAGHVGPEAEADHHETRLRFLLVDTEHLFFELPQVIELPVMRFDVAELLDVLRQAAEVRQVERVHAVDEEDMDVITAGAGNHLSLGDLLLGRQIERMHETEASLPAYQTQRGEQNSAPPAPPTSQLHHFRLSFPGLPRLSEPRPARAVPSVFSPVDPLADLSPFSATSESSLHAERPRPSPIWAGQREVFRE